MLTNQRSVGYGHARAEAARAASKLLPALSVTFLATGCWFLDQSNMPLTPEPSEILQEFASDTNALNDPLGTAPKARKLDFYRDVSGSMSGFASYAWSEYNAVLNELNRRIATSGYELSEFGLGERVLPISSSSGGTFTTEPSNQGQSSFVRLVQHVEARRLLGRVSVVVTDLVQSDLVADQTGLSRAFGDLARTGFHCSLLAFKSSFRGTYWVESSRAKGQTFALDLRDEYPGNAKPFYVLLLAPSAQDLATAKEALGSIDLGAEAIFEASDVGIAVASDGVSIVNPEGAPPSLWSPYSTPVVEEAEGGGSRIWVQVFDFGGAVQGVDPLRIDLQLTPESQTAASRIREADRIHATVDGRTYASETWVPREVKRDFAEVLFMPEDPTHLRLLLRLERPKPDTWDYYRIRLSPGTRNLRSPAWVDDWTTDDDVSPSRASRTLHLDLFVDALKTTMTEKTPFIDLFLQVGRGDQ